MRKSQFVLFGTETNVNMKAKLKNIIGSFGAATSGAVTVWAAFTTPVLIGAGALSVDIARVQNMDNDLQSAADTFARVGAAELDQRPDSMSRATRAIQNLVKNEQRFSENGRGLVEIDTIRYLKSLPPQDYQSITSANVTNNPSDARYVEVVIKPETVRTLFPPSLISGITKVEMAAEAVAGFDQRICKTAPIFFCNPAEGKSESIYTLMNDRSFQRRLIKFKGHGGGNNQYGPGNFGYLDPFGGNSGASKITDALAIDKTNACFSKSEGVRLRPGNIASASKGFNTRFDIYEGNFKKKANDPRYAPAENVVKGYAGKKECSTSPSSEAFGMPIDECFESGTCTEADGRMGNGDWDFITYMKINHDFKKSITLEGVRYSIDYDRNVMTPSTPPSRYSVYRWEIDNDQIPGAKTYGSLSRTAEEGTPTCHKSGPSQTVEDRRVIKAALINCGAAVASGLSMNGRGDPLPVETFIKVFLTQPMGSGKDNVLWGEIIGPVGQGKDSESDEQIALAR